MKFELKPENKKTAIVSYGARITLNSSHIRSVELTYLREYMLKILNRSQVDYLSKITKAELDMPYYKNISSFLNGDCDINDYDEVIIYNSPFNVFGGIFSTFSLDTVKVLLKYNRPDGKLYYCFTDPNMPCIDVAANIKARIKNTETCKLPTEKGPYKFPIEELDRYTKEVWPRISTAYIGNDYDLYYKKYNGMHKTLRDTTRLYDNYDWCHIDFFTYFSVCELPEDKLKNYDKSDVKYDLVYYGNNRHTDRDKIISTIYSDSEMNNLLIGYKPDKALKNCEALSYLSHSELFNKMGTECWATLILGDYLHNDDIITARFFESMIIDVIGFIYEPYDSKKQFVKNQELKDFIYVKSSSEIKDKLNRIKESPEFYKHIIELERQEIFRIAQQYAGHKIEKKEQIKSTPLF